MRAQGQPWSLAWDVLSYLVVITEFAASYERGNWIPYRIACSVIADETAVPAQVALSLTNEILDDLTTAAQLSGVTLAAATSALASSSSVVPGSGSYALAVSALSNGSASIASGLASAGTTLVTTSDFPTAASAAQQSAQFAAAQGYVQRAQTNLANAGS